MSSYEKFSLAKKLDDLIFLKMLMDLNAKFDLNILEWYDLMKTLPERAILIH